MLFIEVTISGTNHPSRSTLEAFERCVRKDECFLRVISFTRWNGELESRETLTREKLRKIVTQNISADWIKTKTKIFLVITKKKHSKNMIDRNAKILFEIFEIPLRKLFLNSVWKCDHVISQDFYLTNNSVRWKNKGISLESWVSFWRVVYWPLLTDPSEGIIERIWSMSRDNNGVVTLTWVLFFRSSPSWDTTSMTGYILVSYERAEEIVTVREFQIR